MANRVPSPDADQPKGPGQDPTAWRATKARQLRLRRAHREAFDRLDTILWEVDTELLREMGAPRNEYDLLVGTTLQRLRDLRTADEVLEIVIDEMERWFGPHWKRDSDRLRQAADRIVAEVLPVFPGSAASP